MASTQRTIDCEECDCVIDDARSIVGINDISGCPEPFSSVYWTFYGYDGRVLGYRRHDSCCNATLRVTYIPMFGLTSTITSESSTASSTQLVQNTTTSSSPSTRQTPTSTSPRHSDSTVTSHHTGTHSQSTTSTNSNIIRVTPSGSGGLNLDGNILFYGLAGVLSLILLVLFISFLLWLKRNKNKKRMTLKEEESLSEGERTPRKSRETPLTSLKDHEPLQSEYSMLDTGDGNGYFLIEKQTDKIVDIKLDKTTSMMNLVDSSTVPEGAYYLLEGPTQASTETDTNIDVYMEIPYQDLNTDKNEMEDKIKTESNQDEVCHNIRDDKEVKDDLPIYNTLNNEESSVEDDACVYNSMADVNEDYDSLWTCQDKEDDLGNYGLFSFKEIDEIMDKP